MINYLTTDCIDKVRWDDCVAHSVNGNVYAWSWYLDVVHPGWEALVETNDGNYQTIMPVTRKKKCFINYLCQPFFVQQLGVFSRSPITEESTLAFLKAIPKKYRLVEIRLNEKNPLPEDAKGVEWHQNNLLDLSQKYISLNANYHENTKRNLKKSFKYGLKRVNKVSVEKVIQLFREDRGAGIKHWGDEEYARLIRLVNCASTSGNAFVCGIKKPEDDQLLCGAVFMKSHQRITFLFSGNSAEGKETQAMSYLIDDVIQEYAGQPMVFDFEGSDDENLARFYHGFGADSVRYPGFTYRCFNPLR